MMSTHTCWDLPIGHHITLRTEVPYPHALLSSYMSNGAEPVLIAFGHSDALVDNDIVYVSTMVIAEVPRDSRFLFIKHVKDTTYKIEGSATHSGHVCLGVNGPMPEVIDMFTLACQRMVEYQTVQVRRSDAILANARKRAREIIADAETVVDDARPRAIVYVRELTNKSQ